VLGKDLFDLLVLSVPVELQKESGDTFYDMRLDLGQVDLRLFKVIEGLHQ